MFLLITFTFMNNVPMNVVLMRCVPTEYSGLSLALSDIFYKVLGDIPGGITLGVFLDQSCVIKDYLTDPRTCDELESCAIFDAAKMNFYTSIFTGFVPKLISFCFAILAYRTIMAKPALQKPYEESTTKTGNFRRASLTSSVHSIKEGIEEGDEDE